MTPKNRLITAVLSGMMCLGITAPETSFAAPPEQHPTRPEPRMRERPAEHPQPRMHERPSSRPESRPQERPNRPESRPQERPNRPESRPHERPNRPESRPQERPNRPLPQIEAHPHKRPDVKPDVRPNRPEPRPDVRPNRPEPRPDVRPNRPEPRPDVRPEQRPDVRPNRPEPRPDVRPEPRPDVRPNRPEPRPDVRPEQRPDVRPNRPEPRPDVRPNHPEPRPEVRPERPHDRPAPRPGNRPVYPPDFRRDTPYDRFHDTPYDNHHGHFHEPPMRHPLFFLPPPPPVYWQQTVVVLPESDPMDGLEYYDDTLTAPTAAPSYDYLNEPQNRIYSWDVFRYYGWLQQYRPFHPGWTASCDNGIGFAAAYNLEQTRYYYYPPQCAVPGTEFVETGTGKNFVFEPSAENRKLLPEVEKTLSPQDVDAAWDFIYGADVYYVNGRALQAEENYAHAMLAQPSMPDPWFRLAVVEMARQNYPQAAADAMKCLDLSQSWPASPFALDDMYKYQRLQKQRDLAALSAAATRDPGNSELQLLLGLMRYADSLGSAEGGKQAMNHFRNAVRLDPGLERYLENLIHFLEVQTAESAVSAR